MVSHFAQDSTSQRVTHKFQGVRSYLVDNIILCAVFLLRCSKPVLYNICQFHMLHFLLLSQVIPLYCTLHICHPTIILMCHLRVSLFLSKHNSHGRLYKG